MRRDNMTAMELIEHLESCIEENDGDDIDVRIGVQPTYPLDYNVSRAVILAEDHSAIYIATGNDGNYMPGHVKSALGENGWG